MPRTKFLLIVFLTVFIVGCSSSEYSLGKRQTSKSGKKATSASGLNIKQKRFVQEKRYLDRLYQSSSRFLPKLKGIQATISWDLLEKRIRTRQVNSKTEKQDRLNSLKLIRFLKTHPERLKQLYLFDFDLIEKKQKKPELKKYGRNIYLRPETLSLWKQCKSAFEFRNPDWRAGITSGYRSPAYQLILFVSQKQESLKTALENTPPPYYSRHQLAVHDVSIFLFSLVKKQGTPWKSFRQICNTYHIYPSFKNRFPGEFRTVTLKPVYQNLTRKKYIPKSLIENLYIAFEQSGHFVPEKAFNTLIAMSYQEAGLSWNPKIGSKKKEALREQLAPFFLQSRQGWTGVLASIVLDDEMEKEKRALYKSLLYITNEKNKNITEYDVYLWTRRTWNFYRKLSESSSAIKSISSLVGSIKRKIEQLQYEPQTFGLWQMNVNRVHHRFIRNKKLWRKYPELIGSNRKPDRHLIVKALSGFENTMTRVKTLKFLLEVAILPRYNNHNIGFENDLNFFIAENLTGEMSTFRAAIQKRLNYYLGTNLVIDGDLSYYKPYSEDINWNKASNSQRKLKRYVFQEMGEGIRLKHQKWIKSLCEANTIQKLLKNPVYRHLMRGRLGERVFPEVKSKLYSQSASDYVERIQSIKRYIKK